MKVSDIMTPKPVIITMDTELREIKEIFDHAHFHHLLVEDEIDHTLVGVISDRDLLFALSPYINTLAETAHDTETLYKHAHQIMSRNMVTIAPDVECKAAALKLLQAGISCMPVINPDKHILGIVTWKDFLHLYAENRRR